METLVLATLVVVALALSLGVASFTRAMQLSGDIDGFDQRTVTGETSVKASPTVPSAWTGILTTRTDGDTGSITMDSAGHDITTGSRVDIYWDGGKAYGGLVGTVAGVTVPITSMAGGDAFPTALTAITVCKCVSAPFNVTGDNANGVAASSDVNAYIVIADAGANRLVIDLAAGQAYAWDETDASANPLASFTLTQAWFSHDVTTGSQTGLKALAVVDN